MFQKFNKLGLLEITLEMIYNGEISASSFVFLWLFLGSPFYQTQFKGSNQVILRDKWQEY